MPASEEFSMLDELPPQWVLFQLITSHYVSRAIFVAAKIGIADLIQDGSLHYTEIAGASGTDAPTLHRLLRLLASAGILEEQESGRFALTPVGELLRRGVPGSRRAQALLLAGPAQQRSWSGLLEIVKTGEVPDGRPTFQFLEKFPDEAAIFNEAMAAASMEAASAVAAAYNFESLGTIVDVGGGHGAILAGILKVNPALRGIVFDLPHAAEGAELQIEASGLRGRCEFVAGDFFERVPNGADAYILKSVLHDWDDARSVAILRNIHQAMAPAGRVLLVEMIYPARVDQTPASQMVARSDVNMLVNLGGRERTELEFSAILDAAGFRLTRIVPTESVWSVVEARR
jgi:SAM-dependent methyltransferase/predicted transcriptional regulator